MFKGWLYAVRMLVPGYENCPIKVGHTRDPIARRRAYEMGGPYPIEWMGIWPATKGRTDEAAIHVKFRDYRLRGEWFEPVPELLELATTNIRLFNEAIAKASTEDKSLTRRFGRDAHTLLNDPESYGQVYEAHRTASFNAGTLVPVCDRCSRVSDKAFALLRELDAESSNVTPLLRGNKTG